MTRYEHTQTAPLYLLLLIFGSGMCASIFLPMTGWLQLVMLLSGISMIVAAFSFRELTVRDEGDGMLVAFGPLPLFRRRFQYSDVKGIRRARSTLFEGFGIHLRPGGGWTWNLWGFDCVDVQLANTYLRIGSDDPEALETHLQSQSIKA